MAPTERSTRRQTLDRLEELGSIVPGCPQCAIFYDAPDPLQVFAPHHLARGTCESGKRPHCSCEVCF